MNTPLAERMRPLVLDDYIGQHHLLGHDAPLRKSIEAGVLLSVGYRINSKRGTQFRQWANQQLKDFLVKGYAINQKRLEELGKIVQFIEQSEKNMIE